MCEMYDIKKNTWQWMTPSLLPRDDATACVFKAQDENEIYLIGGGNSHRDNKYTKRDFMTTEVYNPRTGNG